MIKTLLFCHTVSIYRMKPKRVSIDTATWRSSSCRIYWEWFAGLSVDSLLQCSLRLAVHHPSLRSCILDAAVNEKWGLQHHAAELKPAKVFEVHDIQVSVLMANDCSGNWNSLDRATNEERLYYARTIEAFARIQGFFPISSVPPLGIFLFSRHEIGHVKQHSPTSTVVRYSPTKWFFRTCFSPS